MSAEFPGPSGQVAVDDKFKGFKDKKSYRKLFLYFNLIRYQPISRTFIPTKMRPPSSV